MRVRHIASIWGCVVEDENTQGSESHFGLRKAAMLYAAGVLAFALVWAFCSLSFFTVGPTVLILIIGYIAVGVVLSRMVLRRLISFHPVHDTIHNNFSAKKNAVLFWPLAYPALLFRLTMIRVL